MGIKLTLTTLQWEEAVRELDCLFIGGIPAETVWMAVPEELHGDFWSRTRAFVRFAQWATKTKAALTYDLLPSYRRHVLEATMISKSAATIISWLRTFLKACPEIPEEVWKCSIGRGRKADAEPKRDFLFELFGLRAGYTQDDLKKGYRKAALVFHPDRGGTQDIFMGIVEAYDFLSWGIGELTYEAYVREGGNDAVEKKVKEIFELVGGYSAVYKIKHH
jgi:hypothetical protein